MPLLESFKNAAASTAAGQCIRFHHTLKELKSNAGQNYEEVQINWEKPDAVVHKDVSDRAIKGYAGYICKMVKIASKDRILHIGCGDGLIDSYICKTMKPEAYYGFDYSNQMIARARRNNPAGKYWVQNFVDKYNFIKGGGIEVNKIFSFGTLQYCKPDDLESFFKNQLELCRPGNQYKIIHADVPYYRYAVKWYRHLFPKLKSSYISKKISGMPLIYTDGSYWHNMDMIRRKIENLGGRNVAVTPGFSRNFRYRSTISFDYDP